MLAELGKRIDELVDEVADTKDEFKEELGKRVDELKEQKQKLEDEFEEFKSHEKWQEAKSHFSSAVLELKKGVESLFRKN